MKQYRYIILLFLIAVAPKIGLWAQSGSLEVEIEKDSLLILTRQLHFLSDKELEKLHNGLTVTLAMDMTVVAEHSPNPLYHLREHFAFSFDLWEEKYSVSLSPPDGRYKSHLSAASAEEWCLQTLSVPLDIIPDRSAFMVKLECFVEEKDEETDRDGSSGLTFANIIEYFGRKKSEVPRHWTMSSGFLRLDDLTRKNP